MVKRSLRLTDDEQSQVLMLANQGMSPAAIGRAIGRSHDAVSRCFDKHGIDRRRLAPRKIFAEEQIDTFESLYFGKDETFAQIAKTYASHASAIRLALMARGHTKFRPAGAPPKITDLSQKEEIVNLYSSGFSANFLAAKFKCGHCSIALVLDEAKVTRRGLNDYAAFKWRDIKGREFYMRSSWELQLAQWLDNAGRTWDYEKESFAIVDDETGKSRKYTPDFWIYRADGSLELIIEVKGWLSKEAELRVNLFREQYSGLPYEVWYERNLQTRGILDLVLDNPPMRVPWKGAGSRLSNKDRLRLVELFDQNWSHERIAEEIGSCADVVGKYLKSIGKRRDKSETNRARIPQKTRDLIAQLFIEEVPIKTIMNITGASRDVVRGERSRRRIELRRVDWTPEEDAVMQKHYDSTIVGRRRCEALLPTRGVDAICIRAGVLKLTNRKTAAAGRRALSDAQIEAAMASNETGDSWASIAKELGCSRTTLRASIRRYKEQENPSGK